LTLHSTPPTTPAPPSSPTRRSSDLLKAHELKRGRETRIATNRGRGICFRTDPPGFLLVNVHSQIEWLGPAQQDHRRGASSGNGRSEEHTSELLSLTNLGCRLLLSTK